MSKLYAMTALVASTMLLAGCAEATTVKLESHYDESKSVIGQNKLPTTQQAAAVVPTEVGADLKADVAAMGEKGGPVVEAPKMTPADGKKFVEDYFSNWTTLKASFTQTTDGEAFVQEGVLYAKRPRQFLMRYETPTRQKLVSTGSAIYYVDEDTNTVTQVPNNAGLTSLFTGSKLDLAKQGMHVSFVESTPVSVAVTLSLDSKVAKDAGGLTKVRMVFDRTPQNLRRVEATDISGVTTVVNLKNVQKDVTVDSSLFKYTPPQQRQR